MHSISDMPSLSYSYRSGIRRRCVVLPFFLSSLDEYPTIIVVVSSGLGAEKQPLCGAQRPSKRGAYHLGLAGAGMIRPDNRDYQRQNCHIVDNDDDSDDVRAETKPNTTRQLQARHIREPRLERKQKPVWKLSSRRKRNLEARRRTSWALLDRWLAAKQPSQQTPTLCTREHWRSITDRKAYPLSRTLKRKRIAKPSFEFDWYHRLVFTLRHLSFPLP
ncbi:hypothetical protein B0T24DRAFT_239957 [Lasiosphaeria ovina]|uniref:Uncharacterized protein n=1 Tax=Lasiosphaeria ovina TaxID=92902 RepID=A0AAE0NBP0_9PEZI|nr:hypothetical protein B0T24DRAFT_239957 [Lasiosphaeria ovina]